MGFAMERNRDLGFTLTELLVVVAILAILASVLFPVFLSVRGAAYEWNADGALSQIGEASQMYTSDNDDTYMPAMYVNYGGLQAWFGRYTGPGQLEPAQSLLQPYEKSLKLRDLTFLGKNYFGDHSGFGYNWGFIGSDFHITGNYSTFPQCQNEATTSGLAAPSNTVVFTTSAFYNAIWLKNGDGQIYDFGFVDPIGFTNGNPNVDFRHMMPRQVQVTARKITFPGNALVVLADGHSRVYKFGQLEDWLFYRDKPQG
jgi:prepilin-type N-terminal cleavage/methylation domain-containing protein